jgi:hypothetical protein
MPRTIPSLTPSRAASATVLRVVDGLAGALVRPWHEPHEAHDHHHPDDEVGASVAMRPCYASPLPAGPGWSAPVQVLAVGAPRIARPPTTSAGWRMSGRRRMPPGRFWELPTGSRIAWARVPAKGPRRPTRVVFSSPGALAPALDAAAAAGSCDYLSWSSGLAYRHALPRAELV